MAKNLLAVAFGIFCSIILLGFIEVFFRLNEQNQWIKRPATYFPPMPPPSPENSTEILTAAIENETIYGWQPLVPMDLDNEIRTHAVDQRAKSFLPCCIGWFPPFRESEIDSVGRTLDQKYTFYKVRYSIDTFGRRKSLPNPSADYNILMFGDSYTFGEAVNNEETAAFNLGKMRPKAQIYNFGVSGGSPNEFLYETLPAHGYRLQDIPKRKTIAIYTYMSDHVERLLCRSYCMKPNESWRTTKPYYSLEDGKVIDNGFFITDRPVLNFIYSIFHKSAFVNFFNLVLPLKIDEKDIQLFAAVIAEGKANLEKTYPNLEFYLVIFPGDFSEHVPEIVRAAENKGIKVLDYSRVDIYSISQGRSSIPGDGHPSPITQYLFAWLLNRDLARN